MKAFRSATQLEGLNGSCYLQRASAQWIDVRFLVAYVSRETLFRINVPVDGY